MYGAALVLLVAGSAGYGLLHGRSLPDPLAPRVASAATTTAAPTPALTPTRLLALPGRRISKATAPLRITLGAPVSPTTPMPMLTPHAAGSWKVEGDSIVFRPASTLAPCSHYALTVWARTASSGHAPLGRKRTLELSVACPPTAGLQQALARLGYLGARFRPTYIFHEPAGALTRAEAALHAYHPPRGALVPAFAGAPPVHMGDFEVATRGALSVYQADRGLAASGEVNGATWETLLYDLSHYRRDSRSYTWVTVTESLPQTLKLHRGAHVALTTLINTGVPGAETATGIFPIYARYVSTSMAGTDVDGEKYDVPDVPWVNYFNGGDAVHGYPRASYGFPQSNGCVELPIEAAQRAFGMLALGDLVWVK
jgi:peptidoglycan hydrolase-like protein with peptidoglycan-binding domain